MMRHFFLFLLLLVGVNCLAQLAGRFRIQQFSTEEGLPSNGIKGLQWDEKNGFLWIGTEAGIVRFNGNDFRVFSKQNLPEMNPDRISYLLKDKEGNIFAFNQTGVFFTIEANQLVASPQSAPWRGPSTSGADPNNQAIVQRIAAKRGIVLLPKVFAVSNTSWMITDANNTVYNVTSDTSVAPITVSKDVKEFFQTGGAAFVLKNDNTIRLIHTGGSTTMPLPIIDEHGKTVGISASSRLIWHNGMRCPILFSGEMAWLLEYLNGGFHAREVCSKLPANSLLRFAQYDDKGRTLFIGTESKGIIVVTENRVLPVKNSATSINQRTAYYSQVRLGDSTVLTNEGHVLGAHSNIAPPIKGKFSLRTSASGDSVIWYTQYAGGKGILHRYNLRTGQKKIYKGAALSLSASVVIVGNKTFVATVAGIAVLQGDSLHYVYRYPAVLPSSHEPLDMILFEGKSLVFANCNCLLRFDTERYKLDTLFQLRDYCIRTLKQYKDYLLLGTYGGGFYIYRNGVCKPMPVDKNKFLLYTHCFMPDAAGFCWMSTNRGLFKAKMQDLLDAFEKNTSQVYYHYLGRNDGMGITEMNGGCTPCAIELNEGTLSFPTMDGLLWVNTGANNLVLPEGALFIDQLLVNNIEVPYNPASAVQLSPNAKEIEIALGFPAWCNRENIYLEYRLGSNDPWQPVEVKGAPVIKLSNLPPGSYRLQVRKMNGFGPDNYSYKTISFSIAAPWHKQWWFYVLLAATATGLFILFYTVRTRQLMLNQMKLEKQVAEKTSELQQKNIALEKNNDINTRLISIISHDIVTPLKFLHVAGKNLFEKKSLMPEALKDETIKEITNTSKELQLLSTNILNWIKYQTENRRLVKESFNLHELVNQSLSVLQSLAKQKHIAIHNEVPIDTVVWQYLEPLKILVYNLVTNAINFSEDGRITIGCKGNAQMLTLLVKDEGAGMTVEQINNIMNEQTIVSSANKDNRKGNGLGYLIIKDLLKTMQATLDIQSTPGVGTTVLVTIPIEGGNGQQGSQSSSSAS
jgi:signal transduction histidine kinase